MRDAAVEASVELVGPAKAKAWLAAAARNRPISEKTVRKYASDMLVPGRWVLNGQGIVLTADGRVLDGRHRLSAIIVADVELPMLVVRGVVASAFETMDGGRPRTLSDVLAIEGRKNANALAAATRLAWNYCARVGLRYGPSRQALLQLVHEHAYLEDRVAAMCNSGYAVNMHVPRSALAAMMALANEARELDDEVEAFLGGFLSGEFLGAGDPRLTLRRWLEQMRNEVATSWSLSEPFFGAATKAWNAYLAGEKLSKIRLPMFFSADVLPISGFQRRLWATVPDLTRAPPGGVMPVLDDDREAAP
jgi:hypothetical protein